MTETRPEPIADRRRPMMSGAGTRTSLVILTVVTIICALAPVPYGLAFVLVALTALGLPRLPHLVRRIAVLGSVLVVAAGVVIALWG